MQFTRLARITAAAAVAITVTGVLAAPKALAAPKTEAAPQSSPRDFIARDGFSGVRTYYLSIRGGLILLNQFNCTPVTHAMVLNPIDDVQNKCPTRVWLHGANPRTEAYCVSPFTSGLFDYAFEVSDLQVSSNPKPC
jgi:hypothetical protein